jgi:hypothetical protein
LAGEDVDEDVQTLLLSPDAREQRSDFLVRRVIDADRNADAARFGDELGRFLDRLGTPGVVVR